MYEAYGFSVLELSLKADAQTPPDSKFDFSRLANKCLHKLINYDSYMCVVWFPVRQNINNQPRERQGRMPEAARGQSRTIRRLLVFNYLEAIASAADLLRLRRSADCFVVSDSGRIVGWLVDWVGGWLVTKTCQWLGARNSALWGTAGSIQRHRTLRQEKRFLGVHA